MGSGALSMALLRAGAEVVGLRAPRGLRRAGPQQRGRHGRRAATATGWRSATSTRASTRRGSTGSCSTCPSRGGCCPTPSKALRPGGILCAYLPTINQTSQLRAALDDSGFGLASTLEVLHRTWHIEARSVRPDHRMVGHTGFLTTARLLLPFDEAHGRGARRRPRRPDRDPDRRRPDRAGGPIEDAAVSALLDEDALARALLGRLDHRVLEVGGHRGHAGRAARLALTSAPSLT